MSFTNPEKNTQKTVSSGVQYNAISIVDVGYPATDLLLTKSGRRTLVAAKRWKAGNHGVEPLQALSAARKAQDTSHCVYITLGDVSEKTQRFAAQNGVELLHGTALAQLLHRTAAAK